MLVAADERMRCTAIEEASGLRDCADHGLGCNNLKTASTSECNVGHNEYTQQIRQPGSLPEVSRRPSR